MVKILLRVFGIVGFIIMSWYVILQFVGRQLAKGLRRSLEEGIVTKDQAKAIIDRMKG